MIIFHLKKNYLFPYNNYNNKICDKKYDKYYSQLFLDDCLHEVNKC